MVVGWNRWQMSGTPWRTGVSAYDQMIAEEGEAIMKYHASDGRRLIHLAMWLCCGESSPAPESMCFAYAHDEIDIHQVPKGGTKCEVSQWLLHSLAIS
jgi:hypothetical protein